MSADSTRPDPGPDPGRDPGSGQGSHRGWLALLGLVVLVAASLPWAVPALAGLGDSGAGVTATALPPPYVVEPAVELAAAQRRADPARGRPTRLVVPRLGVDAPVIPIGVVDGVLLPPDDPQVLGWWRDGARPGALEGGALVTGHTVHTGGGAFDHLEALRAGDHVRVRTTRGRIDYAVTGVTVYRKAALARDAARVFSQDVPGRLVLITCEGWNGHGYDSNAVVFADPVPHTG